jgi:hypothetical protein
VETVLMINPDGESGAVLDSNVPKALKQGYERAVRMRAPNNSLQVVPFSLVDVYLRAGFSLVHEKEKHDGRTYFG